MSAKRRYGYINYTSITLAIAEVIWVAQNYEVVSTNHENDFITKGFSIVWVLNHMDSEIHD